METRSQEFVTESREHLAALEQLFLSIEKSEKTSGERERIDHCLRIVHSLKGDAGFLGLSAIRSLADAMETVLEGLRDEEIPLSAQGIETLLSARDRLAALVDDLDRSNADDLSDILHRLESVAREAATVLQDWDLDLENVQCRRGGRLADFFREFEQCGTVSEPRLELSPHELIRGLPQGTVHFHARLKSPDPFDENQRRLGLAEGTAGSRALQSLPLSINLVRWIALRQRPLATLLTELEHLGPLAKMQLDLPPCRLSEALPSADPILRGELLSRLSSAEVARQLSLPPENETQPRAVEPPEPATGALADPTVGRRHADSEKGATLRVQVELLDRLMTLIGELTLVRNQSLLEFANADEHHRPILQRLNSVTSELQGTALRTRMQPVGNLFGKFPRVIRDLGRQLGKQVELTVDGQEVELDKTILEQLSDPLTHLVRNSVDHGIETPDQRIARGKSPVGRLILSARHNEGQVQIEIRDDGRGIDPQAIRAKALSSGLKTESELNGMQQRELLNLILLPGFSTAGRVTEVSGRGVGMDVVKTNLETLEGSLTIDSQPGQGTTMILRVPLTLAIIPCLIVLVDGERFAVPQRDVEEVVCLHPGLPGRIELSFDAEIYRLRNQLLPIIRMGEVLERRAPFTSQTRAEIVQKYATERARPSVAKYIVVVTFAGNRYGLLVDEVRGTEEIVVKPMQSTMKRIRIFNGATIMGDGSVALIANVAGIVEHARISLATSTALIAVAGLRGPNRDPVQAHRLLLFEYGPEERFAVPLLQIRRIVAVTPAQIERVGDREYIVIDGIATRLLRLDQVLNVSPDDSAETMHVVLPKFASEPMALLVSRIVDCDSLAIDLQTSAEQQPGILGTAIVHNRLTSFLDMHFLEEHLFGTGPSIPSVASLRQSQVLLIDDTSFFREAVGRYLTEIGISVTTAVNGRDGLLKLSAGTFDLIISDLEMPEMDGWEFARTARAQGYQGPLLALSSLAKADYEVRAKACGFDFYEEKLNHDRLVQRVKQVLSGEVPT